MNRLNQDTQIVTQDFAQRLANLRREALTPQPLAELRLDHMEYGFDVAPLVVVT